MKPDPRDESAAAPDRTLPDIQLDDLPKFLSLADRVHVEVKTLQIAVDEHGAWDALGELSELLEGKLPPLTGPAAPDDVAAESSFAPRDADFRAQLWAGRFLERAGSLPVGRPRLARRAAVAREEVALDDLRAPTRYRIRKSFAKALLLLIGRALGRVLSLPWETLAVPSNGVLRGQLGMRLVESAGDPACPEERRIDAAIAASWLGLIELNARADERSGEPWDSLARLAERDRLPPLTRSAIRLALEGSGVDPSTIDHVVASISLGDRADHAVLTGCVDRAVRRLGCRPKGTIDLDPIRRVAGRLARHAFDIGRDDPVVARVMAEGLRYVTESDGGRTSDPRTVSNRRHMWSKYVLGSIATEAAQEVVRDTAGAVLALLAQWDVRDRAKTDPSEAAGAAVDELRLSAFAVLHSTARQHRLSAGVASLVRDVLELRVADETAFVTAIEDALVPANSPEPANTVIEGSPPPIATAPTAKPDPKLKVPSREEWLAWHLYAVQNVGNQALVGEMVGSQYGTPPLNQTKVSRMTRFVRAFLAAGGTRPTWLAETPKLTPGRTRVLAPDVIERGRRQPGNRPDAASDNDHGLTD